MTLLLPLLCHRVIIAGRLPISPKLVPLVHVLNNTGAFTDLQNISLLGSTQVLPLLFAHFLLASILFFDWVPEVNFLFVFLNHESFPYEFGVHSFTQPF